MKTLKIITLSGMLGLALACSSSKSTVSNVPSSLPTPTLPTPTLPETIIPVQTTSVEKPDNGVHEPTEKEFIAVQQRYIFVSMDQLKKGYMIFSQGACINCHEPKNIYKRSEEKWANIIDEMSNLAKLTESEKDAVSKYVFAIKAGQASN
jgi:hypothetical protein